MTGNGGLRIQIILLLTGWTGEGIFILNELSSGISYFIHFITSMVMVSYRVNPNRFPPTHRLWQETAANVQWRFSWSAMSQGGRSAGRELSNPGKYYVLFVAERSQNFLQFGAITRIIIWCFQCHFGNSVLLLGPFPFVLSLYHVTIGLSTTFYSLSRYFSSMIMLVSNWILSYSPNQESISLTKYNTFSWLSRNFWFLYFKYWRKNLTPATNSFSTSNLFL